MIESLKGKNVQQLIAEGSKKIGSSGPAPAAGGAKNAPKAVEKEAPKKEAAKKKEP